MSIRLQVLFDEEELAEIKEIAQRQHMTVSEWVRQALRQARRREPRSAAAMKRQVVEQAVMHAFPTADIDQMLDEIEAGYDGG